MQIKFYYEFSKRILKKDICNKILKIYDNPDQINIDELPEQFVLKTNHGSGFNIYKTKEFHYSFINYYIFL